MPAVEPLDALMPDDMLPDPFTACYRRLHGGLVAFPPLVRAVKDASHIIDITREGFEKFPSQASSGDFPAYFLLQGECTYEPFGSNSQTCDCQQTYIFAARTDQLKSTPMNRLKFLSLLALRKLGDGLGGLDWVTDWNISGGNDSPANPPKEADYGKIGWTTGFKVNVKMTFDRDVLDALQESD